MKIWVVNRDYFEEGVPQVACSSEEEAAAWVGGDGHLYSIHEVELLGMPRVTQ